MREYKLVLLVLLLLVTSVPLYPSITEARTERIEVRASNDYTPGYYWCQHLDGRWSTSSAIDNTVTRNNHAPTNEPQYSETRVNAETMLVLPSDKKWESAAGQEFNFSQVQNPRLESATVGRLADPLLNGVVTVIDGKLRFSAMVGHGVETGYPNNEICGERNGYIYPFPVDATFVGYVDVEVPVTGTHTTRHYTTTGQHLSAIFPEVNRTMEVNKTYATTPPTNPAYVYVGYNFSTNGIAPSGGAKYGTATATEPPSPPPTVTYDGSYPHYILHLYYQPVGGEIHVRHMVRVGSSGPYTQEGETQVIGIPTLPHNRQLGANSTHGTPTGYDVSYSGFGNVSTAPGTQASVSLAANPVNQKTAYVSFFYETLPPQTPTFTGDFDVVPGTIHFRDAFHFQPKNFVLNGCTYQSHRYRIERGSTFTTPPIIGQNNVTGYSFGNYPWIIGVGTHMISMQITTSCGASEWIGPKTLTVSNPASNQPPQFQVGFVRPEQPTQPLTQVVEGTVLNLIYIDDPTVPTPHDPDGDMMQFLGFDTAGSGSSFVQAIPSRATAFVNGWHNVTMDTVGFHSVTAHMRDQWGASATASTFIQVVPRNPVAVPGCPAEVVENRPIPESAFTATQSYSPMGRSIDHSRNEWSNRQTSYVNGTLLPITVQVGLHVYDSGGLKSLGPGICTITVKPDLPPVAQLVVPPLGIRDEQVIIRNTSYSPDNDAFAAAEYKFKYDADNDGFANDEWQTVAGTLTQLNFRPAQVGKYLFYTKVTEAYGQAADTGQTPEETLTLNVVNNAPEVSFDLEGKNENPNLEPYTTVSAATMLSWPLYETNSTKLVNNKSSLWWLEEGQLRSDEGRNFGPQQFEMRYFNRQWWGSERRSAEMDPMTNNGYGNNRLSPYRASVSYNQSVSQPLLDPDNEAFFTYNTGYRADQYKFQSNQKYIVFGRHSVSYDTAGNANYNDRLYLLDPAKITPYEMYYLHGSLRVRYTGDSPYIRIQQPTRKTIELKGRSELVSRQWIGAWELAGRFLYYEQNWTYHDYARDRTVYVKEFVVYDTVANKQVNSMYTVNGDPFYNMGMLYTKGANLVIGSGSFWATDSAGGASYGRIYELTPNFEIVHQAEWTKPGPVATISNQDFGSNLEYHSTGWSIGADGSIYAIEYYRGRQTYRIYDIYVVKYNPDFTLAWRRLIPPANSDVNHYFSYGDTYVGGVLPATDNRITLVHDPANNEVIVKLFHNKFRAAVSFSEAIEENIVVRTTNGTIRSRLYRNLDWPEDPLNRDISLTHYGNRTFHNPGDAHPLYTVPWSGQRVPGNNSTMTVEGYRTSFIDAYCPSPGAIQNHGYAQVLNAQGAEVGRTGLPCNSGRTIYGEYMQDGVFVSVNKGYPLGGFGDYDDFVRINVVKGTPSTAPEVVKSFTNGQFESGSSLANAQVQYSFRMDKADYDTRWLGFSFRMQNPRSRYAFETDGAQVALVKYVNGTRTVLDSRNYPFADEQMYEVRIRFVGAKLQVWVNGIPMLEAEDGGYANGRYGYFADKAFVTFSALQYKVMEEQELWSTQYAIWEERQIGSGIAAAGQAGVGQAIAEVKVGDIRFDDPENDPPADGFTWTLAHTPRFLANQGRSALHGQTFASEQLELDAVGDYEVRLQALDDPHPLFRWPSLVFESYRKASNTFSRTITVHRRPISDFQVVQGVDGRVVWTDYSRDPDRYTSAAVYSTEATGIDYRTTRGVLEKRFYYVAPSGQYVGSKLVTPTEIGTYEIGMAVRDEYDAWSDYTVHTLEVGELPPPNAPPVAGFTTSHINTFRGVPITLNSTASDPEDGGRENIAHAYYMRNVTAGGAGGAGGTGGGGGAESLQSSSRTSWTRTFSTLGTFAIRQVVTDSEGLSAEAQRQVTIHNRLPVAAVTVPASSNQNAPTKLTVLRPSFSWTFSDADGDAQARYQLRIYRYGGVLQLDSGEIAGVAVQGVRSWSPAVDLPEKVNLYVQARVYDGYDWSEWSAARYFYIETNRPPVADFSWTPSPVYEGDRLRLLDRASDPDKDALTHQWRMTAPDGSVRESTQREPEVAAVLPGTYTVRLTVSDGKASATAERQVSVLPLGISGEVAHAPAWLARHTELGHEVSAVPKDFYAGELLVVTAQVSPAPVTRVQARLSAPGLDGRTLQSEVTLALAAVSGGGQQTGGGGGQQAGGGQSAGGGGGQSAGGNPSGTGVGPHYAADWHDARWGSATEGMQRGLVTVHFTVWYANGTVKTADVPIRIIGLAQSIARVHRVR